MTYHSVEKSRGPRLSERDFTPFYCCVPEKIVMEFKIEYDKTEGKQSVFRPNNS